jgi:hypothetical protein
MLMGTWRTTRENVEASGRLPYLKGARAVGELHEGRFSS